MDEFWVFGYGSLMWNPGFAHDERQLAVVRGYHRALCIHSWVHRGTEARPGLVLGLDRGGACKGAAFRVPDDQREETLAYLRERELVTNVYLEKVLPVTFADGARRLAVTYVVDRAHPQYAAGLTSERAAEIVSSAVGKSGQNIDYVVNTLSHLRELGIVDHRMEAVAKALDHAVGGMSFSD